MGTPTTALAVTSKDLAPASALAILTRGKNYLAEMSEIDRLYMMEGADDTEAFDFKPTRIKVAAGGGKSFQTADGTMISAPMSGYIIFGIKTRAYWPEKEGNKVPLCSSVGNAFGTINPNYTMEDLRGAATAATPHPVLIDLDSNGTFRAAYNCAGCPMEEFGSAHQGGESNAKACKEKTMMFFLPKGWHQPVILSVPTMSIAPWNQYCSTVKQMTGKPYYAFETRIDIEPKKSSKNQPYGLMQFTKGDLIEDIDVSRAVLALQNEARRYLRANGLETEFDDGPARNVDEDGVIIDG